MRQFCRHAMSPLMARVSVPASAALLGLAVAVLVVTPGSKHVDPRSPVSGPVSARDISLLSRADQVLIQQCMQLQGFEYWPVPESQIDPVVRFPYVLTSVSWARTHGFGGDPGQSSPDMDPNEQYFGHLSATRQNVYSNALVGDGPDGPVATVVSPLGGVLGHSALGCQATAEAELYGSFQAWFQASSVVDALPTVWQAMVLNNAQYGQSVSAWSECMRVKGYAYSSPGRAAAAFQRPASAPMPRALDV
jgi:hypothetical protein